MKKFLLYTIIISISAVIIPYGIISATNRNMFVPVANDNNSALNISNTSGKSSESLIPEQISVYIKDSGTTQIMNTDDYLMGVVFAEMPSSFNEEALKAQAVSARTYLYYKIEYYKTHPIPESHKGAIICTDHAHCCGMRDISSADNNEKEKISTAVSATKNVVMLYDNKPINAVFHSASGGSTESAADVWGEDIPYLQSVASVGDNLSPKYTSVYEASVKDFKQTAEKSIKGINWDNGIYSDIKRSNAGGIISIKIGGVEIAGTEFRKIFSLLSTNADISVSNENIKISVKGYGHGVGMSQYGANYLASNGYTYENILKSYYTGITIAVI